MSVRQAVTLVFALIAALMGPARLFAQAFPAGDVRILVGYPQQLSGRRTRCPGTGMRRTDSSQSTPYPVPDFGVWTERRHVSQEVGIRCDHAGNDRLYERDM